MKQAVIVTSFGVYDQNIKKRCIDTVIDDIRQAFPQYDVFEAWTSRFLINKLAKEGINYGLLEHVLADIAEAGYQKVVIMPTHLTPGEEFNNKILKVAEFQKQNFQQLEIVKPVLTGDCPGDYRGIAETIVDIKSLKPGEELVLMGHGSPNYHNPVYELFQQYADTAGLPVHVGVVETSDHPNLDDIIARLKQRDVKKVFMRPMLLVGGEHAQEDMAGASPASWKTRIGAAGIQVRCCIKGLGENPAYRNLYVENLKQIM